MKLSDAFPSKYINAADIKFPRTVTIIGLRQEEVGQNKDVKWVMYLQGEPKPMVVNKTVWTQIAICTGSDDADNWVGKSIELFQDIVRNPQGQMVPGVRARAPGTMAPPHSTIAAPQMPPPAAPFQPTAPGMATPQVVNGSISMIGTTVALWIAYKTKQLNAKVDVVEIKVDGKLEELVKVLKENGLLKETTARAEGESKGREEERARHDLQDVFKLAAKAEANASTVAEEHQAPPPMPATGEKPFTLPAAVVLTEAKPKK